MKEKKKAHSLKKKKKYSNIPVKNSDLRTEYAKLMTKHAELSLVNMQLQNAINAEGFKIQRMVDDETGLIKLKLYK